MRSRFSKRFPAPLTCLGVLVMAALVLAGMTSHGAEAPEYSVKAAFLFNLGKFVQWPDEAFTSPTQPLTVAVLGNDPFGSVLEDTLTRQKAGGRPLQVWRGRNLDQAGPIHILYIADDQRENLPQILKAMEKQNVLTVSSLPGFCEEGGMVEFFLQDNRVRLAINRGAAEKSRLSISSKLLQVAVLVSPDGKRETK